MCSIFENMVTISGLRPCVKVDIYLCKKAHLTFKLLFYMKFKFLNFENLYTTSVQTVPGDLMTEFA